MSRQVDTNVALVKVNGKSLPIPSEYSGSLSDLDVDSGRSVNGGKMTRNRIRKGVYKLEFSYDLLSRQKASEVLKMIEDKFFQVEFYSVYTNSRITKKMYCGDRSFNWVMVIPKGKKDFELQVQSLKFNFIEE